MEANDKVIARVQTSMDTTQGHINIEAGCEGTLVELKGGSAVVDWDTPDGVKRMPVLDFQIAPSKKVELAAAELKAAASISSDVEAAKIKSLDEVIAEIMRLRDRVAYLEKVAGISHSESKK